MKPGKGLFWSIIALLLLIIGVYYLLLGNDRTLGFIFIALGLSLSAHNLTQTKGKK